MAFDPFRYDWQAPFQDAARRPPAPRRLSLDDLLGMQEQFQPAPRPQPLRSVSELDPRGLRDVRQQSVIQGLAALGAAMQTGDWRYAGQGAGDIAGMQQQAVAAANARAEEDWKRQQEEQAAEIQREQQNAQKAALFGVYEKIAAAEPPGSRLTEKAEAAARAGSMAELQGLLGEVPRRQAARAKGYDPDAWDTAERMQEELAAELKRQADAKAWADEQKRLAEKEEIEAEAELNARIAQREAGVLWQPRETPGEAAAKAEAVARVQQRYREQEKPAGPYAGGRLFEQGKQIVFAVPPSEENPTGKIIPLQGSPTKRGDIVYFTVAGGVRMMQDTSRPDLPAIEVPTLRKPIPGMPNPEYDNAYKQIISGQPADQPPPTPQERAEALGVRNRMTISLEQGADPAEAEALLRRRYPNGIGGVSIERIMAEAKAQAERRRKGRQ